MASVAGCPCLGGIGIMNTALSVTERTGIGLRMALGRVRRTS